MATPEQQRRIDAEALLLQAVAENDVEGLAAALGGEVPAQELLRLRVKPTYNDPADVGGFFHSVASFGLCFGIGDNAAQLAKRNNCEDVAAALAAAAEHEGRSLYESRLTAEAELLAAIRIDSGIQVHRAMRGSPDRHQLARAVVKESYHDAADQDAIHHLVASYGLQFQIGDTLLDLAKRNGSKEAAHALQRYFVCRERLQLSAPSEPEAVVSEERAAAAEPPMMLKVHLVNAMTGADVCTLSASNQWTVSLLANAVASEAPSPGGCRLFLKGAATLTAGTVLADLQEDADEVIQLSTVVMSSVDGVYTAILRVGDFDPAPLLPALDGFPGERLVNMFPRGRESPAHLGLQLGKDGTANFVYRKYPFDRGHCAPDSGGRWVIASGTWSFKVPGVEVVLKQGTEGIFQRGIKGSGRRFKQDQAILLAMVKEGQFDVIQNEGSRLEGASRPVTCPEGAALVKKQVAKDMSLERIIFGR